MKKLAAGFMGIAFFLCASVCWAAFIIHLKDGREIVTPEYWEEDGQIKIKQYGGVVGINRDEVLSIEKSDDVRTVVIKSPPENKTEAADEKGETPAQKEKQKEKTEDIQKKPGETAAKKPPKEKNSLEKEFDSLKKRFEGVESMSKEEIHQFDKDLSLLRNKILAAGLGGVYADRMVELLKMGTKAEEVYNNKDQ